MTEKDWLACTDPERMLKFLRGNGSDRKLRLFAVACCARIRHLFTHPAARQAVEFAEQHVETGVLGLKGRAPLERAAKAAHRESLTRMFTFPYGVERVECVIDMDVALAAAGTLDTRPWFAATYALRFSCRALAWKAQLASRIDSHSDLRDAFQRPEQTHQAGLLRDVFGNPFRPVALEPAWQTADAVALAQAAYDNPVIPTGTLDPETVAVLADALEEAGCISADILNHLRAPGEHVRGCWTLDLLLNKK